MSVNYKDRCLRVGLAFGAGLVVAFAGVHHDWSWAPMVALLLLISVWSSEA